MNHLKNNCTSYLEHLLFAGKISITLLFRGVVFLFHAVIPVCDIPKRWNLENTAGKLFLWSDELEKRKTK